MNLIRRGEVWGAEGQFRVPALTHRHLKEFQSLNGIIA